MATKTITIPRWCITELNGYKPLTTFWEDFSIADNFGTDAVKDTYNRAFHGWKDNYKYVTELALVLNHKIWQHYEDNEPLARVYNDLWEKTDAWCYKHLKKDERLYYFQTTD